MNELKVKLGHKPKRKPNLVRWFSKHNISGNVCSLNCATMRGIERQHLND